MTLSKDIEETDDYYRRQMNKNLIDKFFDSYSKAYAPLSSVYTNKTPKEMMTSEVNSEGWFEWKVIRGSLTNEDYTEVENKYDVKFPKSFIEWHKSYYFLDADCSILRLPVSSPTEPLQSIIDALDHSLAKDLISMQLYPFAAEGNDIGPLVFDGRNIADNNEFPIRVYDHEYCGNIDGLGEIIFSSFTKLIECLTHFLSNDGSAYDRITAFIQIDPEGAGKTGIGYWLSWANMFEEN